MENNFILSSAKITDSIASDFVVFVEAEVKIKKCELHGVSYIGFASYINNGFLRSYVEIGRYCSIGRNVTIGSGAHDSDFITTSPYFDKFMNSEIVSILKLASTTPKRRVIVGNDVWIGDGAYIMSGVKIGNGAIIAAGAIVTKDVPAYSVVAGIPARFIKLRFPVKTVDSLEESKWWMKHPQDISDILIKYQKNLKIASFIDAIRELNCDFPVKYEKLTTDS